MTDNTNDKKPGVLQIDRSKTLSLSRNTGEAGARAPFGGSRGKTVTVEVRKTRAISRADAPAVAEPVAGAAPAAPRPQGGAGLTDNEREARLRALQNAAATKLYDAEEVAAQVATQQAEAQAAEAARAQEKARTTSRTADAAATAAPETEEEKSVKPMVRKPGGRMTIAPQPERQEKASKKMSAYEDEPRFRGKLTVVQALGGDERTRSMASVRRAREKAKRASMLGNQKEAEKIIREVVIPETIEVGELANRMAVRGVDVIKQLMKLGIMATASKVLDADTAELIVTEFGHKFKRVTDADVEVISMQQGEDTEEALQSRPPVVTIMGHVDHGKTSLLDAIRQTDVVLGEAGGITQHIGAYQVTVPSGEKITFLDTPGHEAFTAMRARGAKVTDIVILVVAADDGIMPQTVEAINHAKAAGVPIIVAVNKIDKPEANPSRVKTELLSHELVAEEMGGDIIVVEVSAKTKKNLDKLLEAILLQAEVMELKANPDRASAGVVIEAKVDKGKGVVSTVLVQKGTLNVGDLMVAGTGFGKVRALMNDKGQQIKEAGPSTPVEVLGLDDLPNAGDEFVEVESEKRAREIVEYREKRKRDLRVAHNAGASLESMFKTASGQGTKELAIIVKGDVQGSVEAIVGSLSKLGNEEVIVKVVHQAAGGITESDVSLAMAVNAIIVGFNVRATTGAKDMAAKEKIQIRYYSIIYNLLDDVKAVMSGLLAPTLREQFLGNAEIREVFSITKAGKVAGCMVKEGVVKRGAGVRLIRDNVVIHTGKLKTLKRFKDDVSEVKEGFECGMAFENYDDIKVGDIIEAFEIIEERNSL